MRCSSALGCLNKLLKEITMPDLQATGANPGVEYLPVSGPQMPYNEDRQVTLPSGPGAQMYRTVNAQFQAASNNWLVKNSSAPAYAEVQNPDGSIHYYALNSSGTWDGSGNNAVFNGADFGMVPGTDSTAALNNAINAALNAGGGEVFIPPGSYDIFDVIDLAFSGVPGHDWGVIIRGVSGSTELVQNTITSDVFSFSGYNSGRGIRFQDLRITYNTTTENQTTLAAAVRALNSQNVTCERVYFKNCPQALYSNSLECGLFNCTITYDNFPLGTSGTVAPTMVYLGGAENYIDSCVISQTPRDNTPIAGPVGCIGVIVDPGGGAYYITNTHLSDFTTGIVVQGGPNLTRLFCSNVICESWTNSLVIQQPTGTNTIQQVYCDDCLFARTNGSSDTTSIGVLIGTSGGANGSLGEIFLNNCMCFHWNVAGVQVNAGQKIVVTGGRYGSNAFNSGSTSGGITIAGGADVTISGVDLTPKVTSPAYPSQPYAIAITAAVSGLYVRGCNLSGYTTPPGPLYLSSAGTQIEITDCAGYNDGGAPLQTVAPTSGTTFSNYSLTTPYYGPIEFYVTPGTGGATISEIDVDSHNTRLTSGSFFLVPGESSAITWAPHGLSVISFLAIGK
jgi:hypothetical protein